MRCNCRPGGTRPNFMPKHSADRTNPRLQQVFAYGSMPLPSKSRSGIEPARREQVAANHKPREKTVDNLSMTCAHALRIRSPKTDLSTHECRRIDRRRPEPQRPRHPVATDL